MDTRTEITSRITEPLNWVQQQGSKEKGNRYWDGPVITPSGVVLVYSEIDQPRGSSLITTFQIVNGGTIHTITLYRAKPLTQMGLGRMAKQFLKEYMRKAA